MRFSKYALAPLLAAAVLGGCASKPAESDLRARIIEDLSATVAEDDAVAFADCVAPKLHQELSASSLDEIVDDGIGGAYIDEDDADTGDEIIEECADQVGLGE
ncbi:MAG: hypothetical protein ACK5MR_18150 [Cumulibacter sp.]